MDFFKKIFFFILPLIFLLAAYNDPRLYDGYCPELGRAMTEQEKILAALEQSNKSHMVLATDKETGNWLDDRSLIRYKNGKEIYDRFPECCFVEYQERTDGKSRPTTRETSTEPLRKEGRYAGHVILIYEAPYIAKDGTKRTARVNQSMMITNCGKYWDGI